jgi:hypothetical protein
METISGKLLWKLTPDKKEFVTVKQTLIETVKTFRLATVDVKEMILLDVDLAKYVHSNQADIVAGSKRVETPVILCKVNGSNKIIDGWKRVSQAYVDGIHSIQAWIPSETYYSENLKVSPEVIRFIKSQADMRIEDDHNWYSFNASFAIIDNDTIRTRHVLKNSV